MMGVVLLLIDLIIKYIFQKFSVHLHTSSKIKMSQCV